MKNESVKALNAAVTQLINDKLNLLSHAHLFSVKVKTTSVRSGARGGSAYCSVSIKRTATINDISHRALDTIAEAAFFSTVDCVVEGNEAGWAVFSPTISSRDGMFLTLGY